MNLTLIILYFQTNPLSSAATHSLLVFCSASNHLFNFNVPFFSGGVSEEPDGTSCSSKPNRPDHRGTRTTTSRRTRGHCALHCIMAQLACSRHKLTVTCNNSSTDLFTVYCNSLQLQKFHKSQNDVQHFDLCILILRDTLKPPPEAFPPIRLQPDVEKV